jgi:hypothetical protein
VTGSVNVSYAAVAPLLLLQRPPVLFVLLTSYSCCCTYSHAHIADLLRSAGQDLRDDSAE